MILDDYYDAAATGKSAAQHVVESPDVMMEPVTLRWLKKCLDLAECRDLVLRQSVFASAARHFAPTHAFQPGCRPARCGNNTMHTSMATPRTAEANGRLNAKPP